MNIFEIDDIVKTMADKHHLNHLSYFIKGAALQYRFYTSYRLVSQSKVLTFTIIADTSNAGFSVLEHEFKDRNRVEYALLGALILLNHELSKKQQEV